MDPGALRQHLEASHPDCYAWALACCDRDPVEASDVLQTAYLKVLDGRARFDGRSSFTTWLFAVIRRTAADERRKRIVRRLRHVVLRDEIAADPAAERAVHDDERRSALVRALARLPRRQREVLLLVFYHDRTVDEAAQVMGIGVGSARTHYDRGKRRLRELLRNLEVA